MTNLNYTLNSDATLADYERNVYEKPSVDVYGLMEKNFLTVDEALWYQAWRGFLFLKRLPYRSDNLAAEIRRVVFRNVLNGKELADKNGNLYRTSDGETFSALTDEALIKKMALALQEHYRTAKVTHDFGISRILTDLSHLQNFLLRGKLERSSLIRLIFALGMEFEDFQKFLSKSAFVRQLSPAVPEELVLRYSILNRMSWEKIVRLKGDADKIFAEYKSQPLVEDDDDAPFTEPLDDDELINLSETDFIEEFLRPCCLNAAKKLNEAGKQYSKTAWEFVRKHSILRDVEQDMNGNVFYSDFKADDGHIIRGHETVFLTDTLQRYAAESFFPLKDYDFTAIAPGKVLSQDMYCRFLTYRIITPNLKKGDHATRLYSMKYGELPTEIADNILHYHEIINLPKQRHRIDRYDILIVYFYYFLMAHWKDGKNSFRAKNQAEATALWQTFFNAANPVLEDNGYAEFSAKNPLDLLIRISLLSVAPLDIYLRVCEIGVITSLANDPDFQPTEYPSSDRVWKTLDALTKTYENLNLRNLQAEIDELANLRQRVKKILPRRRI